MVLIHSVMKVVLVPQIKPQAVQLLMKFLIQQMTKKLQLQMVHLIQMMTIRFKLPLPIIKFMLKLLISVLGVIHLVNLLIILVKLLKAKLLPVIAKKLQKLKYRVIVIPSTTQVLIILLQSIAHLLEVQLLEMQILVILKLILKLLVEQHLKVQLFPLIPLV